MFPKITDLNNCISMIIFSFVWLLFSFQRFPARYKNIYCSSTLSLFTKSIEELRWFTCTMCNNDNGVQLPTFYLVDDKSQANGYVYLKLIDTVSEEPIYVRIIDSQKGELVKHLILPPGRKEEDEEYISYVFEIVRHMGDNMTKGLISLCSIESKKAVDWKALDAIPDKLHRIDYKPIGE